MNRIKLLLFSLLLLPFAGVAAGSFASGSVLATGNWYKLSVVNTGIHQITYQDLVSMGIDPSAIDPAKIRIFGNGSGMLPEVNSAPRIDDLREIAIEVEDGGDGRFDAQDRILFYGESADRWNFEKLTRLYTLSRNLYSDSTFYFLNFGQEAGARVQTYPLQTATPNYTSVKFDQPLAHHSDLVNPIRSGKEWYGEFFDNAKNSYTIPFHFPNIDNTNLVRVRTSVVGKAAVASYFYLLQNGTKIDSLKIDSTDPREFTRAGRAKIKTTNISNPAEDQTLEVSYNLPGSGSMGWLNFIEVTAVRHLIMAGHQMSFRDVNSTGAGRVSRFRLRGAGENIRIWDVTNPSSILHMMTERSGDTLSFVRTTDTLREFVAFDATEFFKPLFSGRVANQNLHATAPARMIIVTHPMFMDQAERLAEYHRQKTDISVLVAPVDQVYNEFSCGQPDPTAIRDFVRMHFERGSGADKPAYLLLFGDGSYDPKDRVPGNNNLIPTFQSIESLNSTTTYVTDDYFGIMSPASGQESNGTIDIGVGRFPVSSVAEAENMVDKIIHYISDDPTVNSDWRNVITFVADDEDHNLHLIQADDDLVPIVEELAPELNINKIYFDAYTMEIIPGGERFPDANKAINQTVEKGSLIVNYTGHGSEAGWGLEQVVTTADILSWKNGDKMPVFITATCEFSRFDNPERYTAGEMLINQPGGGAIALYSTTRLAFAGKNIQLNKSFFHHLVDKDAEGNFIRMGDLIRLSKNDNKNDFQLRNFVLLGDPAQRIAFPEYNVNTLTINGKKAIYPDSVRGLSTVTVTGQIEDVNGGRVQSFNGTVACKVFDKAATYMTQGNRQQQGINSPAPFVMQNILLFSGGVPVTEGFFEFTFVVPRGISLQDGPGKISYYATNGITDATGYNENIIIGGLDENVEQVNEGPAISMFINDRSFIPGSVAGKPLTLIADLADTNGINWLGLGIGHELEVVMDGNSGKATVINDYFQPMFNSWSRGSVAFPLPDLAPGKHTVALRAWDMFDNSSREEITFIVPEEPAFSVTNVITAPNPMYETTSFRFNPGQTEAQEFTVTIRIYNLMGQPMTELSKSFYQSADAFAIAWDGTTSSGERLPSGVYPYSFHVSGPTGTTFYTTQKLMIVRPDESR